MRKRRIDNIKKLNIYEITRKQLDEILIKCSKGEPIDHFLFLAKINNTYVALDNEYGECHMEEFYKKNKAICWLIRTDYSKEELKNLRTSKVDELISNQKYNLVSNCGDIYGV